MLDRWAVRRDDAGGAECSVAIFPAIKATVIKSVEKQGVKV